MMQTARYDAIGNMIIKGIIKYTWVRNRKLSAVDNGKKVMISLQELTPRARR